MNILYSFNKKGFEADFWEREIKAASNEKYIFFPFNHGQYCDPQYYVRAQQLDDLYFQKHAGLLKLYSEFTKKVEECSIDAVIVDNRFPYHPDFLKDIKIHKVLRTTDGPLAAYDRDFAYVHAYDQVLYHSPAYSEKMSMPEKLRYCGANNIDFWPLALFDAAFDHSKNEDTILAHERDIDIIFIGALHFNKMDLLSKVKKYFGKHCQIYGLTNWKRNLYFNFKYKFPGWITPIDFEQYVPLYQRAKIGFNVHNRGCYTVGSYRLFELCANGVMQISDGGQYLKYFFDVDKEIVGYTTAEDLIEKIKFYLENEYERNQIALNGFKKVLKDYRFTEMMHQAGELISSAIYKRKSVAKNDR